MKKSVIVVCNLGLRNLILWSISLTLLRANDSSSWRLNCAKSFSCSAHFLFLLYRGCLSSGSNLSSSSSSPFRHPNSNFLTCLPDLVHRSAPRGVNRLETKIHLIPVTSYLNLDQNMAVKSFVLVVFLIVCLVWGSSASLDEGKLNMFCCMCFVQVICASDAPGLNEIGRFKKFKLCTSIHRY